VTSQRRKRKLSVDEIFAGAYMLYSEYYNPYTHKKTDIFDTIDTIKKYRDIYLSNEGELYFFGFTRWKRKNIKNFFKPLNSNRLYFCSSLEEAKAQGLKKDSKVYIWGKKEFRDVEKYCVNINRIEDGFIRSVTLGSDLTKAYSIVVDSMGIYFDPTQESELEFILHNSKFDQELLERAKFVKNYLIEKKLSKYNIASDKKIELKTNKKIVLVVGQVEDDASIIFGGNGMGNLELLKKVKSKTDGYIIYKPHPDVLAGNRKGNIQDSEVLKYADITIKDISLPSLLDMCDELHTITSLSGFEALIREKKVFTYGIPFYAGWGLSVDEKQITRDKSLTIDELVAGTLILYPRYINPTQDEFCEVEVLIEEVEKLKIRYNNDIFYKMVLDVRNFISRKIQFFIKVILGE